MERCHDLDVVVIDLQIPGLNGHDALAEFGRRGRPCVVLSSSEESDDTRSALDAGHPNKIIARRFDLSESTVKAHISTIFQNVQGRQPGSNGSGRAPI